MVYAGYDKPQTLDYGCDSGGDEDNLRAIGYYCLWWGWRLLVTKVQSWPTFTRRHPPAAVSSPLFPRRHSHATTLMPPFTRRRHSFAAISSPPFSHPYTLTAIH